MFDMDGDHSDVYDNKCYEKIDLRFCKILLDVQRKATNTARRGELVDTQFPCIFWNKFLNIGYECLGVMGTLFCMHVN